MNEQSCKQLQQQIQKQEQQQTSSEEECNNITRNKMVAEVINPSRIHSDHEGTVVELGIAYRLDFSCHNTGKYIRRSKRRIKWRFGFASVEALREGKKVSECRGEEHEVELVLSSNSNKARVFWNKQNITNYFHHEGLRSDKFEFVWQCTTGETLRAIAHMNPVLSQPLYDFFIDGVRFSELPALSELRSRVSCSASPSSRTQSEDLVKHQPLSLDLVDSDDEGEEKKYEESMRHSSYSYVSGPDSDMDNEMGYEISQIPDTSIDEKLDFRLSMIGLSPSSQSDEIVDELRSDLYSSTLDSLRSLVVKFIPQTEEMVSLAIINAFNADDDGAAQTNQDSILNSCAQVESMQLEAEAINEAYLWLSLNKDYCPDSEMDDRCLDFLQKMVDTVVFHIRQDRIPARDACRILISVATTLGVTLENPVDDDTVIFNGISNSITADDLRSVLSPYGTLSGVAVVENGCFGICRFADVSSIGALLDSAENEVAIFLGSNVNLFTLSYPTQEQLRWFESTPKKCKDENDSGGSFGSKMVTLESEGRDATPAAWVTPEHPRAPEWGEIRDNLSISCHTDTRRKREFLVDTPKQWSSMHFGANRRGIVVTPSYSPHHVDLYAEF